MIKLVSPTKALIEEENPKIMDLIRNQLSITDKQAAFALQRAKNSPAMLYALGQEAYKEKLSELKAKKDRCLLFEDDSGSWTYSGLAGRISRSFNYEIQKEFTYPERELLAWAKTPKKNPRPYQEEIVENLLREKHAAVQVATGLGKTFCILNVIKRLGLKTVVMAPSKSIAYQIFEEFSEYLGARNVGLYGDGKKEFKKLVTIGIDKSLAKIEKNSPAWHALSGSKVFIADESHLTPANTLQSVCMQLLSEVPYRFFFSGTQLRNDGLELVLEGIVGPVVYEMTVKQGVDQGFLAKPVFTIVETTSDSKYTSKDVNNLTRAHGYYNPKVNKIAGDLANRFVSMGRQTLILIEEVEQFTAILPYLNIAEIGFAHGPLDQSNKDKVPEMYHDSNNKKLVQDFNSGKIQCLVGTSCISTGTDIQSAGALIRLKFGKSEIEVRQDIGRGTRKTETKSDCMVVDFDVANIDDLSRHTRDREMIYEDIYGPVNRVTL